MRRQVPYGSADEVTKHLNLTKDTVSRWSESKSRSGAYGYSGSYRSVFELRQVAY